MRKTVLLPLLLALALPACGDDPVSTPPTDLAGPWTGQATLGPASGTYVFDLRFTQDGQEIGGEGQVRVVVGDTARDSVEVSVAGRYRNPELAFTLSREGFAPLDFNGRIFRGETEDPDSMVTDSVAGTLSGSGFTNRRLKLTPVVAEAARRR